MAVGNGTGRDSVEATSIDLQTGTKFDLEKGQSYPNSPVPVPRPFGVKGNPAPLGLLCFGMTTCMLMFIQTTWTKPAAITFVISYALFYGGAGQLIAGILELIRGNSFAGTAFSSYGAFWMGFALWNYWSANGLLPDVGATAKTGDTLFLCLWGFLTFFFFIVTLRKNGCLQTIFGTLFITFFLLAGGNYSENCGKAAGYFGFFCGCSAIYTAIAELYQETFGWPLPGLAPLHWL